MCAARATSREHAPPRNLFPEAADMGGKDYRINLITVPSCNEHNSEKSHDDEFLMVSLAGIIGNNSIGYLHRFGKVERAIKISANRLLEEVLLERSEIHKIEVSENKFIEVIWGTADVERLKRCFRNIAYALHHKHFRKNFVGRIEVLVGYLVYKEYNDREWTRFIADRAEIDLKGKKRLGSNPDVFYFQVTDVDAYGLYMMRLCFYGNLVVWAAFIPDDKVLPENLADELIAKGVKVVLRLGDEHYAFNPSTEA